MLTTPTTTSTTRASWLVAAAFTVTMLGTTLPTPLYPLYEQRFGFGPLTVTVVFAAYAAGVLVALLAFGRASDALGRRPVLLAGLLASGASSLAFLVVGGLDGHALPLLLAARVVSGLSAGVFTGTATAALADLAGPDGALRGTLVASVANIGGLGLGPLLAGLLARHAPRPLLTPFAVHVLLLALAATGLAHTPAPERTGGRLQVQRLQVPRSARPVLVRAGTAGFAGFAVMGLFTAVSPAVLRLLGHTDPALTGLVVLTVFAASLLGQGASVRLAARPALLGGTAALVAGIALVGVAVATSSLPLLVGGGAVAFAGQGLSFRAALSAVTAASPPEQRGSVASCFFAVCYVGLSLPVVGIGAGTRAFGLAPTAQVFAAAVAALGLAALVSLARTG